MRQFFLLSLVFLSFLSGNEEITKSETPATTIPEAPPTKSPEEISRELDIAQADFEIAQKMFIPWYTGPLITGSASNCPPKRLNFQPYLYLTMNNAAYNSHGHTVDTPKTYIISPLAVFQTGITNWWDVTIVPQGFFRWENSEFASNFGDLPLQFGFQIYKETPYIPNIRFVLGELFPTGNYQNLNPNHLGLDATGSGAFQTIFTLIVSKVFWWSALHPIAARLALNSTVPDSKVTIHGYNAFGGGDGTDGKVSVGNSYSIDLGLEASLTQQWVIATDIVYNYGAASTFSGKKGTISSGEPAHTGSPSNYQLSLAPAIEYNIDETSGFIGGVWFTVAGRNSSSFISILLSYTKLF